MFESNQKFPLEFISFHFISIKILLPWPSCHSGFYFGTPSLIPPRIHSDIPPRIWSYSFLEFTRKLPLESRRNSHLVSRRNSHSVSCRYFPLKFIRNFPIFAAMSIKVLLGDFPWYLLGNFPSNSILFLPGIYSVISPRIQSYSFLVFTREFPLKFISSLPLIYRSPDFFTRSLPYSLPCILTPLHTPSTVLPLQATSMFPSYEWQSGQFNPN